MKLICKIVLGLICLLYLFGCQSDDQQPTKATMEIEIKEVASGLEVRNGGQDFVFFDASLTIVHTLLNLNPQFAINPNQTDSIVCHKVLPEQDAIISSGQGQSKWCWKYDITIYQKNDNVSQIRAYAPYTFGLQKVIIPAVANSWTNNIQMVEIQRGQGHISEFDFGCLYERKNYQYRLNYIYPDTSMTKINNLRGSGCNDLLRVKTWWQ